MKEPLKEIFLVLCLLLGSLIGYSLVEYWPTSQKEVRCHYVKHSGVEVLLVNEKLTSGDTISVNNELLIIE